MIVRSQFFIFPALVWNAFFLSNYVNAFLGYPGIERTQRPPSHLNPHRFNSGYDPASPLAWTPQQAAEFTIFHGGSPEHAGMQLRTAIQHWSGDELAEFLTRLYLGYLEVDNTDESRSKLVYEPQNVRSPQWKGLSTREGIVALKTLLRECLSKESLSAREIARFAEAFLLKEYRWPSGIEELKAKSTPKNRTTTESDRREPIFEQDSFYSLGHARTIARILMTVRNERHCETFNANDIALMVTLPEKTNEDREIAPFQLIEFFRTIVAYTPLTEIDKANIVQRMAISGWSSGSIPRFMAELLPEGASLTQAIDEMCRFQGDSFMDFPTQARVEAEENARKEKKQNAAAMAIEKDRSSKPVVSQQEESKVEPTKQTQGKLDTKQSEYEELVQSYWKNIEVTKIPPTTKKSIQAYGVPKTKAVKQRKIPDTIFGKPKNDSEGSKSRAVAHSSKIKEPTEEISMTVTAVRTKENETGPPESKSSTIGRKKDLSKTKSKCLVKKKKNVLNNKTKTVVEST